MNFETKNSMDLETGPSPATSDAHNHQVPEQQQLLAGEIDGEGSSYTESRPYCRVMTLVWALPILLGIASSALFMGFGLSVAIDDQQQRFERRASELVQGLQTNFDDYLNAVLMFYQSCRHRNITRTKVREVYEHLTYQKRLEVRAIGCVYNLTHEERLIAEQEGFDYYGENYPDIPYQGVTGLEPNETTGELSLNYRSVQPFYFPVRYMEPVKENEAALDFDLYSSKSRAATIRHAIFNWTPAMTERIRLVQETEQDAPAYSVLLMHPGIPLSTQPDLRPRDLASVVIRIPDLLSEVELFQANFDVSAYIFDSTDPLNDPVFLGGSEVEEKNEDGEAIVNVLAPEVTIEELRKRDSLIYEQSSRFASKEWTIVVVPSDGAYQAERLFVIFGGIMILVVSFCLALFMSSVVKGTANRVRAEADAEKSYLLIESANATARMEREINDFVAHEVRNPLSAAISAMSFVTTAMDQRPSPLEHDNAETLATLREDLGIVTKSLQFINELLRSMLDMHRAASNQLKINKTPTELKRDVLEPVEAMLYSRGNDYRVTVDCPGDLVVATDKLRLSQIMLNLGRNSSKFVHTGFVRLCAFVEDDNVHLAVEDSGLGIPESKRNCLFEKFQETLDTLNQGTGIGLCLVKQLVDHLGAEIWLDDKFDSGIENYPGTRFVIRMNQHPMQLDSRKLLDTYENENESTALTKSSTDSSFPHVLPESKRLNDTPSEYPQTSELPKDISVLFVDDDTILRKLFSRAIKRVAPDWKITEAASGEAALSLVDSNVFDIIFLDMYMASIEKQMLGTETVVALRNKGVESIICGLSANNLKAAFLTAGANYFVLKPIPSQQDVLIPLLLDVLTCRSEKPTPKDEDSEKHPAQPT